MNTFNDRKKAFEGKFVHDQDKLFRATSRRNKLLGLWAAEQLGYSGEKAETYTKELIVADFEEPGDGDLLRKLRYDFEAALIPFDEEAINQVMDNFMNQAIEEIEARSA